MQQLPKSLQWVAAIIIVVLVAIFSGVSLVANALYMSQFGPIWTAVGIGADIGKIMIPVAVAILAYRNWWYYPLMAVVITLSVWTGLNQAASGKLQGVWERQESAALHTDNKQEIARLARDLSQITEVATPSALRGQIEVVEASVKSLTDDVARESDPQRDGPCRSSCEAYKRQLAAQRAKLAALQDRLGQAETRVKLTNAIKLARQERKTAAPVKQDGLTEIAVKTNVAQRESFDLAKLIFSTGLYLLIVEGFALLSGWAASLVMAAARYKPEEPIAKTIITSTAELAEVNPLHQPVKIGELTETSFKLSGALYIPAHNGGAGLAEPVEQPTVAAAPVQEEPVEVKKERKRRKDGRFAKRPGPKPKPKFKLNSLPRPKAKNVVELKDFRKDD